MLLELLALGAELFRLVLIGGDEQLFADRLVEVLVDYGGFLRFIARHI